VKAGLGRGLTGGRLRRYGCIRFWQRGSLFLCGLQKNLMPR
jgi:hypothetical protein